MAISKILLAGIKAISYSNIELKKNYKLFRAFEEAVHKKLPVLGVTTTDERIANITVRVFTPSKLKKDKILVFFHGGGWVSGSIDSYDGTCSEMAKITGSKVISVEYSLSPENKFPIALEECYNVTREIIKFCEIFNKDKDDIVLIGDSAGANLAAAVSLMARDRNEFRVEKQILIYPVVNSDHSLNSPFNSVRENGEDYILTSKHLQDYVDLYVSDENDLKNAYMAPILSKNFSKQPDTLIITGEYDPLRDEGEDYGKRLAEAGNYVEVHRIVNGIHGFLRLSSRFTQVKITYEYINSFLRNR